MKIKGEMMTANQLYKATLAVMSENESNASSYNEFVVPNINLLLSELFDAENSLRVASGANILINIPEIATLNDELPYQELICRTVMPYGLAVYLSLGDDEYSKAGFYDSRYQVAKLKYSKANYVEVEDHYSDYEE